MIEIEDVPMIAFVLMLIAIGGIAIYYAPSYMLKLLAIVLTTFCVILWIVIIYTILKR